MRDLEAQILELVKDKPRILIVGIGENRMGDDGFGPFTIYTLIETFQSLISSSYDKKTNQFLTAEGRTVKLMNAGIVFDSRIKEIVDFHPDIMLIIDAIEGNNVNEGLFLFSEQQFVPIMPISSHSLPIHLVLKRIREKIELNSVYLLGIKPLSLNIAERFVQFQSNRISLDEFDDNLDLPFFEFNLSPEIESASKKLVDILVKILINQ